MARKTAALVRQVSDPDLDLWAGRINGALAKTVEGIFETGRQLLAARERLKGKWCELFAKKLVPINRSTAYRFIEIYKRRDVLAGDVAHVQRLPPSWGTLYQLARLPDDTLEWAHAEGKITPDLERQQIKALRAEYEGTPLPPSPRAPYRLDSFGVRTAGSKLVTEIEQRLDAALEKLPDDDRAYVIAMLKQKLETLDARRTDGSHTEDTLSRVDPA